MSLDRFFASLPASRFTRAPAWLAALVLGALVVMMAGGLAPVSHSAGPPPRPAAAAESSDVELYKAIIARMAVGQNYYTAAAAEQRTRIYPLRPFVTMRLPTLATIHAVLGAISGTIVFWGLIAAVWIGLDSRLRAALGLPAYSLVTCVPVALALAPALSLASLHLHEPWAAVLVGLSLLARRRERWVASVLLGLAAVLIRELALPYLCLMAMVAALDGARRECGAWLGAIVAFAVVLTGHAYLVSTVVTPADLASPGWAGFGGWRFLLAMAGNFTGFAIFPAPVVAVLLPLALVGLAGWRGDLGLRAALLVGGYCCAFMLLGRADNDYWALMIAPFLPLGLVFAPGALRDLVVAARDGLIKFRERNLVACGSSFESSDTIR